MTRLGHPLLTSLLRTSAQGVGNVPKITAVPEVSLPDAWGGEWGHVIREQLTKSQHPADLELPVPVPAPANLSEGGQKKKNRAWRNQAPPTNELLLAVQMPVLLFFSISILYHYDFGRSKMKEMN